MTEEESKEIHRIFHDRYYYKDGYLYRKKNNKIIMGCFVNNAKKTLFEIGFSIRNNKYHWIYSHAIYFFHTGIKPEYILYKDGNETNHTIENLILADKGFMQSMSNMSVKNKHNYKGVIKDGNKFYGRLWIKGKYKWLKGCETAGEAHRIYLEAKQQYFKEKMI